MLPPVSSPPARLPSPVLPPVSPPPSTPPSSVTLPVSPPPGTLPSVVLPPVSSPPARLPSPVLPTVSSPPARLPSPVLPPVSSTPARLPNSMLPPASSPPGTLPGTLFPPVLPPPGRLPGSVLPPVSSPSGKLPDSVLPTASSPPGKAISLGWKASCKPPILTRLADDRDDNQNIWPSAICTPNCFGPGPRPVKLKPPPFVVTTTRSAAETAPLPSMSSTRLAPASIASAVSYSPFLLLSTKTEPAAVKLLNRPIGARILLPGDTEIAFNVGTWIETGVMAGVTATPALAGTRSAIACASE